LVSKSWGNAYNDIRYDQPVPAAAVELVVLDVVVEAFEAVVEDLVDVASVVEVVEAFVEVAAVVDAVPGRHWSSFFSPLSCH
jgi:hypothetical protein